MLQLLRFDAIPSSEGIDRKTKLFVSLISDNAVNRPSSDGSMPNSRVLSSPMLSMKSWGMILRTYLVAIVSLTGKIFQLLPASGIRIEDNFDFQ